MLAKMNFLYLIIFGASNIAFADCQFAIANYSSTKLVATVGFYHGESKTLDVPARGVNSIVLKSNLECTGTTNYGGGVSFIRLGNNVNTDGGWVYVPNNDMYRALGIVRKDNSGAFIKQANKKAILLKNTYKPNAGEFSVRVEDTGVGQNIHDYKD